MGTERNEAGESQELKAIPLCLLKKKRREGKRREERRTEKVKVDVEVEVEVKERISCSVRGETGNSRAWQFPDSSVTYPIARPRANPTQIRLATTPDAPTRRPLQPSSSDPATLARSYQILKFSHLQYGSTALPGHTRFGWRWCSSIGSCDGGVGCKWKCGERAWSDARADLWTFPWPA
jgi:hypothetical protein